MSLWDQLFEDRDSALSLAAAEEGQPMIQLCFDELPSLDMESAVRSIRGLESISDGQLLGRASHTDGGQLFAAFRFGAHQVDMLGLASPIDAPDVAAVIDASDCSDAVKGAAKAHRAHVTLYYHGIGRDPIEQYLALYKVASCFAKGTGRGVVNLQAQIFHSAEAISDLCRPLQLSAARRIVPLHLWCGLRHFETSSGNWYVTSGLHLFKLPELAYYTRDEPKAAARALILAGFNASYLTPTPGTTFKTDDRRYFQVRAAAPEEQTLGGPLGASVIQPITAESYEALTTPQ